MNVASAIAAKVPADRRQVRRWWVLVAGIAWVAALATCWTVLLDHAYQPSIPQRDLQSWPAGTQLAEPATARFRIVMFAHPFCPCTRATLHELNESLARLPRTAISVVFVTAGLSLHDVAESSTLRQARALPGVDVRLDASGDEAQRFGAKTSGEVLGFDRHARLIFRGGITPARGHQGDAFAQKSLETLALDPSREPCIAPVFGCPLPVRQADAEPNESNR